MDKGTKVIYDGELGTVELSEGERVLVSFPSGKKMARPSLLKQAEGRRIIAACCLFGETKLVGARHFSPAMHSQLEQMNMGVAHEQGFIDQFDEYWSREDAMALVKYNGQPFDIERNGGSDKLLFSEGVW